MSRGGGRGGGVGGGGGGIGGRVRSSSHSPSHGASSGSTVVRDAAAITGGYLGHSLIRSVSNNFAGELWFKRAKVCKMVVLQFELCGIFHRYSEGKDAELCQNHLKDLNEFCGEFKPSWNDWWTHDLKRNFCQFKSDALKRCMEKGPAEAIPVYKELLEDVCGRKF